VGVWCQTEVMLMMVITARWPLSPPAPLLLMVLMVVMVPFFDTHSTHTHTHTHTKATRAELTAPPQPNNHNDMQAPTVAIHSIAAHALSHHNPLRHACTQPAHLQWPINQSINQSHAIASIRSRSRPSRACSRERA
jgi:hypothetical protein